MCPSPPPSWPAQPPVNQLTPGPAPQSPHAPPFLTDALQRREPRGRLQGEVVDERDLAAGAGQRREPLERAQRRVAAHDDVVADLGQ